MEAEEGQRPQLSRDPWQMYLIRKQMRTNRPDRVNFEWFGSGPSAIICPRLRVLISRVAASNPYGSMSRLRNGLSALRARKSCC